MTERENGAQDGGQKPSRGHVTPEGVPFTTLTAKQAQKASVRARNMRTQMRTRMLEHLVANYDFPEELLKALKEGDGDRLELISRGLRLLGLTHDQSEDAVQKVSVDSRNDSTVHQTVRFVVAPRPEKAGG